MLRLLANRRVLASAAVIGGLIAVALWPTTVPVDVAPRRARPAGRHGRRRRA